MKKVLASLVIDFSGEIIPFSLFNATKASSFQLILLMIYDKILTEEVSYDLSRA